MRLICPFCGERDRTEFGFRQLAPEPSLRSPVARVYERLNRHAESIEYWQHLHGCRAWLIVHRNPTTSEIASVQLLGGAT